VGRGAGSGEAKSTVCNSNHAPRAGFPAPVKEEGVHGARTNSLNNPRGTRLSLEEGRGSIVNCVGRWRKGVGSPSHRTHGDWEPHSPGGTIKEGGPVKSFPPKVELKSVCTTVVGKRVKLAKIVVGLESKEMTQVQQRGGKIEKLRIAGLGEVGGVPRWRGEGKNNNARGPDGQHATDWGLVGERG